jgi:putative ABC transport system permease protein
VVAVRALNAKLLRDLWQMRAQALAIIAVIGTGVAMFAMYLSTFASLDRTRDLYYDSERFADVFAGNKRAPAWLAERIAEIPGVSRVDTRVVVHVTLDIEGLREPARGRLISIPEIDRSTLNDLVLRRGRYIDAAGRDEVLVHEAFASAHGLEPGDRIAAIINGRRRELPIAGIALSPEYVYVIGPGDIIPDQRRFGVIWMGERALASAFDMEGGFNDVSLRLEPGRLTDGEAPAVIDALDRILEPYGGLGAISRRHQPSHWFIENELREMRTMASILPVIFLGVAAFLLNVVLSRTIAVQRTQIAVLKAVGYTPREVAFHYLGLGALIAVLGSVVGCGVGAWLGRGLTNIYAEYFRFPMTLYELPPWVALAATAIAIAAATLGSLGAVRRVNALPPAEAMRPEPPARFEPTRLENLGLRRFLAPEARMIVRNVARKPLRFALSAFGVGMAIALMVLGAFFIDAIDYLIELQFDVGQRQDVTVTFVEPQSAASRHELARLPGVLSVEPFRSVPVRLRHENRSRRAAILGLPARQELSRVIDRQTGPVTLPPEGLVLSRALGDQLDAREGDEVIVEVLEGARPRRSIRVAQRIDDLIGLSAYMEADALARLMREDASLSGAFLAVDEDRQDDLYQALKATPSVAGVGMATAAMRSFRETVRANMMRIILFNVLFSCIIAVGVVYNAARISLSEHSRDLASLRVLGFSRGEIARILLGELGLVTLAAIPIGIASGSALAWLLLALLRNELYRIPYVIEPATYGQAVLVVLTASLLSGLLVRRRLDRLDLVAALKTRE